MLTILDLFRAFEELGHEMIIWSGGGLDYARMWRDRLGLRAVLGVKFDREVDMAVDDMGDEIDISKYLHCKFILRV